MHVLSVTLGHALIITGFVSVMMLVLEYLNVLTRGRWDRRIARWSHGQTVFSAFLGVTPGCLGAYAVGSLYMHRVLTFGALQAAMLATCGDEAFVMLALFPRTAMGIMAVQFVLAVVVGTLVNAVLKSRRTRVETHVPAYVPSHDGHGECIPFSRRQIVEQWRRCTPERGLLTVFIALLALGILTGAISHHHIGLSLGPEHGSAGEVHAEDAHGAGVEAAHAGDEGAWLKWGLLVLSAVALAIVVTVPDHFLQEHLWHHLVRVHVWRIFLWTFGTLLVTDVLVRTLDLHAVEGIRGLPLVAAACLVGLIPQSGPHLVFVILYSQGAIPLSVLMANCIVQDGHGMVPMLAHSRRAFAAVKGINLAIGLIVGVAGYLLGW